MKKTQSLQVAPSMHIEKGHAVLHPNEGFDLGMMRLSHPVQLCTKIDIQDFLRGDTGSTLELQVDLLNECPKQTLQLNAFQWKSLGEPPRAIVLFDGDRLFIQPLLT